MLRVLRNSELRQLDDTLLEGWGEQHQEQIDLLSYIVEIAIPFGTRQAESNPLAHVQAPKTADAHAYIALWMEIFGKTVHDMTQREWKLARQEDWPDTIFGQNIMTLTYGLRKNTISLPPPGWGKAHGGTDPVFTARCGWQRHGGSYHMLRAARYVEFAQDLL